MSERIAKSTYETKVDDLRKFCEDNTEFEPIVFDEKYPFSVTFYPKTQMSFFDDENVDKNGEPRVLTVTVGLSTTVTSTLSYRMNSKLLRKLIKKAEDLGGIYYQAFREGADHETDL